MSFDATDIVPIEYKDLFAVISPVEKSGILRIIKNNKELENIYERFYFGLLDYLTTYQNEDISSLVFIMFAQVAQDTERKGKIIELIELFPKSHELQFSKIQSETDKGNFEDIGSVLALTRLSDEERNQTFNRLISADKLAKIILDLQSFDFELRYYIQKQDYDKVKEIYSNAEKIWKQSLNWIKDKPIIFLIEQIILLILSYANTLSSIINVDAAVSFFEEDDVQKVLKQAQSTFSKCTIAYVSANIYYSASQPQKAVQQLEKAISLLSSVFGRKQWKSNFYHNYAVMLTIIDTDRSIEAFEKSLEFLDESEDHQSIATTLSNLISLKMEIKAVNEAREMLLKLVNLIEKNEELATPFRVYSVAVNAISLEDPLLAKKYLEILRKKTEENPTPKNMGNFAGANLYYYTDLEINYEKATKWGSEYLYYVNKENNYLNIVTALFNITLTEFQFYKMAKRNRYLNASKKRLKELLSFIGKLEREDYLAIKNALLASYEILLDNYQIAREYLDAIPETTNKEATKITAMLRELFSFILTISTEKKENDGAQPKKEKFPRQTLFNEIATNKDTALAHLINIIDQGLNAIIALPTEFQPGKADIKLILLLNNAGIAVYTKMFDERMMDKHLISNFIAAINSFGNELFGTHVPYFSITRGNNIILFQNVNPDLNLAMIANQENYDSISKLNSFAKEIKDYLYTNETKIMNLLQANDTFYKWLERSIEEMMS